MADLVGLNEKLARYDALWRKSHGTFEENFVVVVYLTILIVTQATFGRIPRFRTTIEHSSGVDASATVNGLVMASSSLDSKAPP